MVKILLDYGADVNRNNGQSLASAMSMYKINLPIIELLLSSNVQLTNRDYVAFAINLDKENILKLLLKYSAPITDRSFFLAIVRDEYNIVKLLLQSGFHPTQDHVEYALSKGYRDIADLLIEYGAT